jgi:hypothetical protein
MCRDIDIKRQLKFLLLLSLVFFTARTEANELNGKALLCKEERSGINRDYGLVFGDGTVSKWFVVGYQKKQQYTLPYNLSGTNLVKWQRTFEDRNLLFRETLRHVHIGAFGSKQYGTCDLSSKEQIFRKFDEIISAAKKKNKI